jgi:hypothetical protein
MSIGAKITKDLGNNKYEIEVTPVDTNNHTTIIGVAHDYVLFSSYGHLYTKDGLLIKSSNTVPIQVSLQIPIVRMGQVGLPLLNNSNYLKPEHYNNYGVWNQGPIKTWSDKDDTTMHVYDKVRKEFVPIPVSLYNQLTNPTDEQED